MSLLRNHWSHAWSVRIGPSRMYGVRVKKLLPILMTGLGCSSAQQSGVSVAPASDTMLPSAAFLAALPDGDAKRAFIGDCTGCHTLREEIAYVNGAPRTHESWQEATARMLGFAGAHSNFPVISAERDAASTAKWLAESLPARSAISWRWRRDLEQKAEIRTFMLPEAKDLPHDLAIADNRVIVTGMFTARMYIIDPATGGVTTEGTPEPNPRAVEIDSQGNWWVVLGGPKKVARRSRDGSWQTFDAGFYAHSVAIAPDRGVWVNGHFTHAPELLRRIDPMTGAARNVEVPAHPDFKTTPVPYEVRAASSGEIWLSELLGNRIVRYDPASNQFKHWPMPARHSAPRRLDVDPNGIVWIPEYAANRLARFDPRTEQFTEYELPLKDSAPYVARWDARRGVVWIGTGAADALFRFDPRAQRFTYYRLSESDLLVRHLVIDGASGDIWLAPGASPGRAAARVIRVRPLEP